MHSISKHSNWHLLTWIYSLSLAFVITSCDHGLEPPDILGQGAVIANIEYIGNFPPSDSLNDLRFVLMGFVPQDTADFLRLNEITFSSSLKPLWIDDTLRIVTQVLIDPVTEGSYVYNGVAQQFSQSFFDWQPVGLVEENGGTVIVEKDQTTTIGVKVDFYNRPPFPPE